MSWNQQSAPPHARHNQRQSGASCQVGGRDDINTYIIQWRFRLCSIWSFGKRHVHSWQSTLTTHTALSGLRGPVQRGREWQRDKLHLQHYTPSITTHGSHCPAEDTHTHTCLTHTWCRGAWQAPNLSTSDRSKHLHTVIAHPALQSQGQTQEECSTCDMQHQPVLGCIPSRKRTPSFPNPTSNHLPML
jgi:hypothetical protein